MATDDEKIKFSIYLPAGTVADIDAAAAAGGITRAEWIRRSCDQTLHPPAPVETPADTRDTPAGAPVDTREIDALTARIASLEEDIERARADAIAARLDAVTATADRLALVERAARADGLAAARLEELERVRADLERERDGRRRDLIETAAGYVRTALPSSSTPAADETTRRTVRERVRSWLRR